MPSAVGGRERKKSKQTTTDSFSSEQRGRGRKTGRKLKRNALVSCGERKRCRNEAGGGDWWC